MWVCMYLCIYVSRIIGHWVISEVLHRRAPRLLHKVPLFFFVSLGLTERVADKTRVKT